MTFVYRRLLELNDYKHVIISKNVRIKGISGATNEFDVYYEFKHLNLLCKVAFECKDWNRPVSVGEVRDFAEKINDVGPCQIIGVMVSKNGYQSGAELVAGAKGIALLDVNELPNMFDIIAGIIKKGFLPDEIEVGDPFWTLMEIENGNVTGTYFSVEKLVESDRPTIPLFYSPYLASEFLKFFIDKDRYCVRGISQYQLKKLIDIHEIGDVQFGVFYLPVPIGDASEQQCIILDAGTIKKIYFRE